MNMRFSLTLLVAAAVCFSGISAWADNDQRKPDNDRGQTVAEDKTSDRTSERTGTSRTKKLRPSYTREAPEGFEVIEMFSAMEEGTIEVRYIPKDATEATVWFENKSDRPVSIELPEVFAFVPVLAQGAGIGAPGGGGMMGGMGGMGGMGMGGMGGMGGGMGGGQGGMGGFGGGMGGGMMGGGMMGGGMMNVPPDMKVRTKVTTVCLEHNKRDPNPKLPYTMIPVDQFTQQFTHSSEIVETGRLMIRGQISQPVAQATVWHFTDNMSWFELADKNRIVLRNGYVEKFFSQQQVMAAQQVAVHVAQVAAAQQSESESAKTSGVASDDSYRND